MSSVKLIIPKIASCNSNSVILKIIRDHGPISRSRIVEYADQPMAAVSRTISRLLKDQAVVEIPFGDDSGPRKKRALCLNPNLGHCLAINYCPDKIEATTLDTAYGVIAKKQTSLNLKTMSKKDRIQTIVEFIQKCQSETPASAGPCLAMAIIDPGVVDEASGTVLMSTIMEDWSEVPMKDILEKQFGIPILLLNTSTANIRAVDRFELNNAFENLIYIEYQSGIACGLKLQGVYITGRSHLAGEFGHMKVTDNQVPCRCGSLGCLEAVAAIPALGKKLQDVLQEIPGDKLNYPEQFDAIEVLRFASEGDRLSQRIVEEAFEYLGSAVGGLVNLLAPNVVVFDNNVSLACPEAIATLLQSARKNMLTAHIDNVELKISQLNSNIPSLGGAVALLDTIIDY